MNLDDFETLGLPPDLFVHLRRAGLHSLEDIARLSVDQVLSLRGIGELRAERLRQVLASNGLSFRPSDGTGWRARERRRGSRERRL